MDDEHIIPANVVAAARKVLDEFGPDLTRPQAALLLRYWLRRDQLTPADLETVLGAYPKDARAWMRRDPLEFGLWAEPTS